MPTLIYENPENTVICVIDGDDIYHVPVDPENAFYAEIKAKVDAGVLDIQPYSDPVPTWKEIRNVRNIKLLDCDYTQVADSQLSPASLAEFVTYRQELRDIPQTYANPEDVVWPTEPVYQKA